MTLTSTPRSTYDGICPFAHRCSAGACTAGSTLGSHERANAIGKCTHSNPYSDPPIVPLSNCWTEPLLRTLSLPLSFDEIPLRSFGSMAIDRFLSLRNAIGGRRLGVGGSVHDNENMFESVYRTNID